ncbi:MAG: DUF218 domain-containing protein [Actinobacteria bacterium]|nr:DUF218 domain-containing protein [Actinomycetota bacterium]
MSNSARTRPTIRTVALAAVIFAVLAVGAVTLPNTIIIRAAEPYRVASPTEAPSATVAIVLGAQAYLDGTPSPMLADRLRTGIELYRLGRVKKLLLSGDHGRTTYDEVNTMKHFALEAGVPEEDVFLDHAGFSTYETMYRARDVFLVHDALVVTQDFHLDRAVATARALGLEAVGVEAPCTGYEPRRVLIGREWLARCKAWLELNVIHPLPTYLGETISITGDGRATWD